MTAPEWFYLTLLAAGAVLYLGDAINATTAALREILAVLRKDKP